MTNEFTTTNHDMNKSTTRHDDGKMVMSYCLDNTVQWLNALASDLFEKPLERTIS